MVEEICRYCGTGSGCFENAKLSQKQLAERMDVSPQQISKIVKGQENLTLETISNLEIALGIQIIDERANMGRAVSRKKKPAA